MNNTKVFAMPLCLLFGWWALLPSQLGASDHRERAVTDSDYRPVVRPRPGTKIKRVRPAAGKRPMLRKIQWHQQQRALAKSLNGLGRTPRLRRLLARYRRELHLADRTLQRARMLQQTRSRNLKLYNNVIRRLRQHRRNIKHLQAEIAKAGKNQKTVRNDRQLVTTQFENANQKASQYVNMLASVLKTMHEMQQGVIRNLR